MTPAATPSPTPSPVVPGVPPPGDGFTRVVLPPELGYLFGTRVITPSGFNIEWFSGHLIGAGGVRFSLPFEAATPDEVGAAPAGSFGLTAVTPTPGTALFVRIETDGVTRIYGLWIPAGQEIKAGSPLTFDWKLEQTITPPAALGALPPILGEVPLASNVFAGGAGVATTNLLFTAILVILLLAGGEVFNEAMQETLEGWSVRRVHVPGVIGSPLSRIKSWASDVSFVWARLIPDHVVVDRVLGPVALLFGTGFIYSLLEPEFGFNEATLTLFVSLVISEGALAVAYEGGKAWLYRRHFSGAAGVKLFPACVLIAFVSVIFSRLTGLHPGIVVGFIAAAVIFERERFSVEEQGRALARIGAITFAIAIAAWLLAIPLHHLYDASPNVWTALPDATSVGIFVVCMEGLFFSLVPLHFMDGWRIWHWKRLAWVALFVPTALMFVQVLYNTDQSYFEFISSHETIGGLAIIFAYLAATWGTWAYLKWRAEQQGEEAAGRVSAEGGE